MTDPASTQVPSVGDRSLDQPGDNNRRRIQRISLPLPVRVEVRVGADVGWNEMTRLIDVSAFGAGFTLKRPVKRGRVILMTIPMPRQLRSFDYGEPQYRVWALVRRCIPIGKTAANPEFSVGVGFTGKAPPPGFAQNPSILYDIAYRDDNNGGFWQIAPADLMADESQLPNDLRKQTRFSIPEMLRLERIDADGNVIEAEETVTENISLGGASVFTTFKADAGTFFRVTSDRYCVTILAIARGNRLGTDGITRVHLEFIDRLFPLEGIE